MSKDKLIGAWKLVAFQARRESGRILPVYGKNPVGRLFYDAHGNMSVHIMRSGRPKFKTGSKFSTLPEEMMIAYQGYEAYFSTYEVDEHRQVIHHKVIGSLFPNWTGSIQDRYYKFERDDRLVLSTKPFGTDPSNGTIFTLIWERMN